MPAVLHHHIPNLHMKHVANDDWYGILDPTQAIRQYQTAIVETASDRLQGQLAPGYTLPRMYTWPRSTPSAGEVAETQIAQRSIHCRILTSSETLIVGGMLAGVLMLPGILTKILKLAGVLTGILMLARIRTGIQKLSGALASKGVGTSDRIPVSDRTHAVMGEVKLD